MLKEFYVGFLLLLLSFLYLSHLTKTEDWNLRTALHSRTLEAKATLLVANNEKEYR